MNFDHPYRAAREDGVGFVGIDERGRVVEFRASAEAIEILLGRAVGRDGPSLKTAFEEASNGIFAIAGRCLLTAVPMVISADMARKEVERLKTSTSR